MTARMIALCLAAFVAAAPANAATVEVTDGDSLIYDGVKAEIWGIIAPSRAETCTTMAGINWACGERVFAALSALAADETFACIQKEPGFVTCQAGGLDVGLLLVREGLARARQDYAGIEARAKEARVGIWE
ncbi:MAG: hypothetical protein Q8Q62_16925 [Mesorhizobium sp.]|nr:hypothetical protein [Mesorhizobium sp.]